MRVFAYCLASAKHSVRRMAGVEPALCPASGAQHARFRPGWLEYRDLVMFKLHGLAGATRWDGDNGWLALADHDLERIDLMGAIVFAENCYLPESPMLAALLSAGASGVVGGSGVNYGGVGRMAGADVLGLYFRNALELGASANIALRFAKARLRFRWPTLAVRDTLEFQLFTGG